MKAFIELVQRSTNAPHLSFRQGAGASLQIFSQLSRFIRTASVGVGKLSSSAKIFFAAVFVGGEATKMLQLSKRPSGERAVIFASPSATAVTTRRRPL